MREPIRFIPPVLFALLAVGTAKPGHAQTGSRDTSTAARPPAVPASPVAIDPAAPSVTAYRLTQVGGQPLPVEVEREWRCSEAVTAGTLTLSPDGRWRLETTKRETCGDRTKDEFETDDGRYTTEGTVLRFFDDDGEDDGRDWSIDKDVDLDDLRAGTLNGGGMLTVQLADGETTLVFRR